MEHVGRPVRVFWENENEWYRGHVEEYLANTGYHIVYLDGDEEWLASLQGVEFEDEEVGNGARNNYDDDNNYAEDDDYNQLETLNESRGNEGRGSHWGDTQQHERDMDTLRTLSVSPVSSPKRVVRRNREERENIQVRDDDVDDDDEREERAGNLPQQTSVMEEESLCFQSSLHSTKELNTNGVLLKGEVIGGNNLPISAEETVGGAGSVGVFYRVLYAEGGDESAVFRCKTPIYKSSVSRDLEFPRWDADRKFRFEMVLPGDEEHVESDFTDHGDIIVAVYKSRANGGSDFIGQVCIQLQDFIRVGTVGRARPNSHCRLIKGCFPLISRHGDIVGDGLADVDVDLSLEWRLLDKPPPARSARDAIEEITARNKKAVGKGGSGTAKAAAGKRPMSGNKPGVAGGRNSSAAMSTLKASRRSHQQTLLDAQNDKLRSRLERAGPKQPRRPAAAGDGRKASDQSTVSEIYKPAADRVADKKQSVGGGRRTHAGCKDTDRKRTGPGQPSAAAATATGTAAGGGKSSDRMPVLNLNGLSHDELVSEYESLRKKVGEAQLELKGLQIADSKLKAQVAKHEAVTGRLKKTELSNRKKTTVEAEGGQVPGGAGAEEGEARHSVKNLLLRAGIEDEEETLSDELLRERLVEHSVLQAARLSCLERIEKAEQVRAEDEVKLQQCKTDIQNKFQELENRAARINKPKSDWNLHILNKESKISSLKNEVFQLNMIRKLNLDPEISECFDN